MHLVLVIRMETCTIGGTRYDGLLIKHGMAKNFIGDYQDSKHVYEPAVMTGIYTLTLMTSLRLSTCTFLDQC